MDILKKKWIYIIAGFVVYLFMGCSLAWSVFVVPLETLFNWTRDQTSLAFTINILMFAVGSILTGMLSKKLSFSMLLKISAILMCVGFLLSSLISSVFQLYLTYGVLVGVGIGLGYNCVLSACPLWLPEKAGTATGILLMGYALSTAIFGPVLNTLISSVGIVNTFRTLGFVCGAGIFIGSFFIRVPKLQELEQLPQVSRNANKKTYNVITSEMVKKPIFWVYFIIVVLFGGMGLTVVNHCSPMLTEGLAVSATLAALVVSITSICNGVSRFLWGIVFDKIGVKRCLLLVSICFIVASVGMFISFISNITFLFIMSACLMYASYGGNAITCASVIRELFGHRTFSLNFSVLSLNTVINSFFPTIIGLVQVSTGTYILPLMILIGVSMISMIMIFIFTKLYNKDYENGNEALER
ncbi:MAG: MFS transporter [Erysipelotrichaceae bacterium]|nr:MFS transporter [Erysipelotrichaceae bacterium]